MAPSQGKPKPLVQILCSGNYCSWNDSRMSWIWRKGIQFPTRVRTGRGMKSVMVRGYEPWAGPSRYDPHTSSPLAWQSSGDTTPCRRACTTTVCEANGYPLVYGGEQACGDLYLLIVDVTVCKVTPVILHGVVSSEKTCWRSVSSMSDAPAS